MSDDDVRTKATFAEHMAAYATDPVRLYCIGCREEIVNLSTTYSHPNWFTLRGGSPRTVICPVDGGSHRPGYVEFVEPPIAH